MQSANVSDFSAAYGQPQVQHEFAGGVFASASILLGPSSEGPSDVLEQEPPIMALWDAFFRNVHPLTHIVHLPSAEEDLRGYAAGSQALSSGTRAWMFSMCACALLSLDDAQSFSLLGRSRLEALATCQRAARAGLIRSGLLVAPDLRSLQTLAFYIVSVP